MIDMETGQIFCIKKESLPVFNERSEPTWPYAQYEFSKKQRKRLKKIISKSKGRRRW